MQVARCANSLAIRLSAAVIGLEQGDRIWGGLPWSLLRFQCCAAQVAGLADDSQQEQLSRLQVVRMIKRRFVNEALPPAWIQAIPAAEG